MNEQIIADATRKLAQTAIDLRQQRDDAEQALSQAYYLVTGRSPAWSDTFGHEQALEDIGDAVAALKLAARPQPPAAMSWGDGSLCVYGDGKSIAAVHAALTVKTMRRELKAGLLPCPFCGGPASHSMGKTGDGKPWPYIECEECGACSEPDVWNKRAVVTAGK